MEAQRQVTNSFIELLRRGTKKPIGDHQAPTANDGTYAQLPYAIVYTLPQGPRSGAPLGDPVADGQHVYQVTAIGEQRDQAEGMADLVRRTVLYRDLKGAFQVPITHPELHRIHDRDVLELGQVVPEGDAPNELYSVMDTFLLWTTPA
jgi:hypothetical protein